MKTTLIAILIMLSGTLTANAQMDKQDKKKSMEQKGTMMQEKEMTGMQGKMMPMKGNMMMQIMPMHGNMMMQIMPMQGDMIPQEMPMHQYMMMVKMLPRMQDKLSLSTEQTKELIDMRSAFEKQQVDMKAEMTEKYDKLKYLLKNEASVTEVETQLQKCAETRVKMFVASYETSMKMREVLNDEQQEKACKMMNDNSNGMMNQ